MKMRESRHRLYPTGLNWSWVLEHGMLGALQELVRTVCVRLSNWWARVRRRDLLPPEAPAGPEIEHIVFTPLEPIPFSPARPDKAAEPAGSVSLVCPVTR